MSLNGSFKHFAPPTQHSVASWIRSNYHPRSMSHQLPSISLGFVFQFLVEESHGKNSIRAFTISKFSDKSSGTYAVPVGTSSSHLISSLEHSLIELQTCVRQLFTPSPNNPCHFERLQTMHERIVPNGTQRKPIQRKENLRTLARRCWPQNKTFSLAFFSTATHWSTHLKFITTYMVLRNCYCDYRKTAIRAFSGNALKAPWK